MHYVIALSAAAIAVLSGAASNTHTAPNVAASAKCFARQDYCSVDATSLSATAFIPAPAAKADSAKSPSQDERDLQAMVAACRSTFVPPNAVSGSARGQKGGWYYTPCATELGTPSQVDGPLSFVPDAAAKVLPVLALALEARRKLVLPVPSILSSPGPGADVPKAVNFPTWAWIDRSVWVPMTVTASAPGVAVSVSADPMGVEWSWGDGSSSECQGPGVSSCKDARTRPRPHQTVAIRMRRHRRRNAVCVSRSPRRSVGESVGGRRRASRGRFPT